MMATDVFTSLYLPIIIVIAVIIGIVLVFYIIYRMMIFFFNRKVHLHLLRPTNDGWQVVAEKQASYENVSYIRNKRKYILNLKKAIMDKKFHSHLYFSIMRSEPLTFYESDKGNSELLHMVTKTDIWSKIFGETLGGSVFTVMLILVIISLCVTVYLVILNNQANSQITLLEKQISLIYNATKAGGVNVK